MAVAATGIAASRADAFPGEGTVVQPGSSPPALTPSAKDVLQNPKTIPELINKGRAYGELGGPGGGAAEANGAARVFQLGRVLPAIGTAVAGFAAGWEVGAEICGVVGISGCFHLFGDPGTEPVSVAGGYPGGGSWVFKTEPFYGVASYNWVWKFGSGGGTYENIATGLSGSCVSWTPPGDHSVVVTQAAAPCYDAAAKLTEAPKVTLGRYGMEGLNLEHNASDDPGIPNVTHSAGAEWSEKTAGALTESAEGERVGQYIASEIEGSEVASPYTLTVEIPNCDGLLYAGCVDLLEERDLVPDRLTRTWEDADVDGDPDEVLELDPAKATEVEKGSTVVVTTNPDEEGMPIVIPAPKPGQTYEEYAAALNPALSPTRVDLPESSIDPDVGPNGVVRTAPEAGTRANPATSTPVEVMTNPKTAPAPRASGGTPPAVPSVDLGPITGLAIGCSTFPFGIFCWLGDGLSGWSSSGTCSSVDVPLGTSVDPSNELPFDLCQFEPAMEIIRPVLVLVATLCLGWFFAAASMGLGGGNDD